LLYAVSRSNRPVLPPERRAERLRLAADAVRAWIMPARAAAIPRAPQSHHGSGERQRLRDLFASSTAATVSAMQAGTPTALAGAVDRNDV